MGDPQPGEATPAVAPLIDTRSQRRRVVGITLFMLIALGFSYVFRIAQPEWHQGLNLPAWLLPFRRLPGAFGIFLGAFIAERAFGTGRRITITGTSARNAGLMIVFPVLLFAIIGVANDVGIEAHLFGLAIGLQAVFWVFLEEYGWWGYLQNELSHLRPLPRYLLIGGLWYVWHFWFLRYSPVNEPVSFLISITSGFAILFGASWGLGVVAESTRSILAAACFHMLGSLIFFNPIITESVAEPIRWTIFALCLVFWVVMLRRWIKQNEQ